LLAVRRWRAPTLAPLTESLPTCPGLQSPNDHHTVPTRMQVASVADRWRRADTLVQA
jgi:hypothetical protein